MCKYVCMHFFRRRWIGTCLFFSGTWTKATMERISRIENHYGRRENLQCRNLELKYPRFVEASKRAMAVDIPRLKCPGGGPRINQFYELREAENIGVKSPRGDCYLYQWQSVLRGDIEKGRNWFRSEEPRKRLELKTYSVNETNGFCNQANNATRV